MWQAQIAQVDWISNCQSMCVRNTDLYEEGLVRRKKQSFCFQWHWQKRVGAVNLTVSNVLIITSTKFSAQWTGSNFDHYVMLVQKITTIREIKLLSLQKSSFQDICKANTSWEYDWYARHPYRADVFDPFIHFNATALLLVIQNHLKDFHKVPSI